jgi:hypothetical protein
VCQSPEPFRDAAGVMKGRRAGNRCDAVCGHFGRDQECCCLFGVTCEGPPECDHLLQERWKSGRISHLSVELVGFGSQGTARYGPLLIDVILDEAPASISAVFVLNCKLGVQDLGPCSVS